MASLHNRLIASILCLHCLAFAEQFIHRNTFLSPMGKFAVDFKQIAHIRFEWPADSLDEISHVKYLITFRRRENSNYFECEYVDVYGEEKGSRPVETAEIFRWFIWSPKEDFAILPVEGWRRAPSSPYRKTICLNSELGWDTVTLHIDIRAWANDLRIIGDIHDDCDYKVLSFDGKTGRHEVIRQGLSPVGYEIATIQPPILLIRKVLDNCATDFHTKNFIEECEEYNCETMISKKASCNEQ